MFGQCLLLATGISGISTTLYGMMTTNENKTNENKDSRKSEYISIFSIIVAVSFLLLFMFHGTSEGLVIASESYRHSASMSSGKPPF
jgi:hypothetical protein|tara:strand:+ start:388 stop:648 length:261 start_codon:yes stop_codon:yes gene_type:complete